MCAKKTFITDHKTRNKSFLMTYLELESLGIQNCKFFLKLYDRDLVGVNPRDPNLDRRTMAKILLEIESNPWYYYREVVRIPVPGKKSGVPFRLHRGNLAILWCLHNSISATVVLPRQNFKSISSCCYYQYQFDFGTESSTFLFMNKQLADSVLNLKRVRDIR
jgi:hypothetical protein